MNILIALKLYSSSSTEEKHQFQNALIFHPKYPNLEAITDDAKCISLVRPHFVFETF